jgi:hypothetical protein
VRFQLQATDLGLLVTLAMALLSARLLRLAIRTRRLPELLVGIYFLAAPLAISVSIRITRFDPQHAEALRALVAGLFGVGGIALLLFAWCVFHPRAGWAKALAWGGSAAIAALWAAELRSGGFAANASFWGRFLPYASYLWVFVESLRYWRLLRRRLRIGLADPVVVNRFLLFAIWTGCVVAITILGIGSAILAGGFREENSFGSPVVLGITRLLTLPIGLSIWLTFLAPRRYHTWIERRSAPARG